MTWYWGLWDYEYRVMYMEMFLHTQAIFIMDIHLRHDWKLCFSHLISSNHCNYNVKRCYPWQKRRICHVVVVYLHIGNHMVELYILLFDLLIWHSKLSVVPRNPVWHKNSSISWWFCNRNKILVRISWSEGVWVTHW